ncbi:DUF4160 domain-containing protein [Segatella copri]
MFEGDLPKKAQELVTEWLSLHSDELQEMWDKQILTKLRECKLNCVKLQ